MAGVKMKADQKLHRALTNLIYKYFEDEAVQVHGGGLETEDYLLRCIHEAKTIAKKYHKEKYKEDLYKTLR
jgi:hypothetical protein